jgi:hypothetical protein
MTILEKLIGRLVLSLILVLFCLLCVFLLAIGYGAYHLPGWVRLVSTVASFTLLVFGAFTIMDMD